jgi:hypothetical protein
MKQSQDSGLDSLVEYFFHIFIPQPPLFLSIIPFTPLSPPFSHIPSHSFYVLSLSVTFKQLVNVIQNSPPCYVGLLHSFSVKIHDVCEHKQLYINMAFTYNTWWHKVHYEKMLVTQLVKEVLYLFWHVFPEDHYNIHNNMPDEASSHPYPLLLINLQHKVSCALNPKYYVHF